MSETPDDLRYSRNHEWVRANDDGSVTIGITDHAQDQLGDLVYVEVPEPGREVEADEACAVVESVKAASDVYAPIAGTVTEANEALADTPEAVNPDAYGEGWLIKLKPSSSDALADLMDVDAYREFVEVAARQGLLVLFIDDPRTGRRHAPRAGLYATASVTGTPAAGVQVCDGLRGLAYLLTRSDVDPGQIGIAHVVPADPGRPAVHDHDLPVVAEVHREAAAQEARKAEEVNPAAGCLPILIQMPFFLAFYWVLLESVEMRQAPFALWITDLSSRDPYFILPLIMGAAMFFQQKLNPQVGDPVQMPVMLIMPVIFTAFFAFFPSGLVLYWVTNTVLSIAQQWKINRVVEAEAKAEKQRGGKKGKKEKS